MVGEQRRLQHRVQLLDDDSSARAASRVGVPAFGHQRAQRRRPLRTKLRPNVVLCGIKGP